MCKNAEYRTNFHFWSERDSPGTYVLQSIYTPFQCTHTLWKVFDLAHDAYFPYILEQHNILQAYHIFYYFFIYLVTFSEEILIEILCVVCIIEIWDKFPRKPIENDAQHYRN